MSALIVRHATGPRDPAFLDVLLTAIAEDRVVRTTLDTEWMVVYPTAAEAQTALAHCRVIGCLDAHLVDVDDREGA